MRLQHVHTSDWLSSSWHRSSEAGLKQRKRPDDIHLAPSVLKQRRHQSSALINIVERYALPLFSQMFARTDSRLILTDQEGVILASWGQERFKEKLTSIALSSGACWQEQVKGTNAIGTALIEAKPVTIIGEQHFIHQHRFISCSASPLFDHLGQLIGILDITSEQQQHDTTIQVLVQSMVQQVENHLLDTIPDGSIRIDLACDKSLLRSGWQGIVIANESGEILAHNQVATQLLDQTPILGKSIDALLDGSLSPSPLVFQKQHLTPSLPRSQSYTASSDLHFGEQSIEDAWQQANRIINNDISLLILGETGVGKGEFVKALHKQSKRKSSPLVSVNCGALPKDLIESELFGYAPGAFTGANNKGYQGKIRQADKGILFLDEIADMPLEAQCRLLQVLQDKTVVPVGSNQHFNVDCQIIAATHKDLEQLIADGQFREDLYYRITGLTFRIPSLRDRHDKLALISHIHQKYVTVKQTLCPQLMALLCHYSWPGNIRELDNVLKVSTLLSGDEAVLTLDHLPTQLAARLTSEKPSDATSLHLSDGTTHADLKTTVDDTLLHTYNANQGNISKTSRVLGISRNTIYRKLKQLGIL